MRVVVTGATGNVGSGVLGALVEDPSVDEIVGVARRLPTETPAKVRWVAADVATDELDVFEGADAVIHLAWMIQPVRDEATLERVNVEGTRRVLSAVRRHRVETFVVASSVGAYSFGPKEVPVDETWPTDGIRTSIYSRQKAEVERMLAAAALEAGAPRIVRMRTSLVFSERAASEIARLFLGPFAPTRTIGRRRLPIVPRHPRLTFQVTHTDDIGRAYLAAIHADFEGPVNVAASPPVDADALAGVLGARPVRTPAWLLRGGAGLTHFLRVQPTSPGWIDLAFGVPTMATRVARDRLGWEPRRSATEAIADLLDGLARRAGTHTAPLEPLRGGTMVPFTTHAGARSDSRARGNP